MKVIAAFDFDGTITKNDTLLMFLIFTVKKSQLIWGGIILSPILVLYKLKLYSNWKAKQKVFTFFFKGMPIEKFNLYCKQFAVNIAKNVRHSAIETVNKHKRSGDKIIIVSASIENWIMPWSQSIDIDTLLATKIEIDANERITGQFLTPNCYGQEKVNRLLSIYPERGSYILYAYGDSKGDRELINFSDYGYYNKFK